MNEETKKRIAAINSGIIPEGYKKTKVGIVPVEWEDTHFSELFIEKKNVTSDFEKYPLYSLTIEEGVVPKSERYERSHLVKKDDIFKIVSENDFVYNPMNVRFGALARYKGQEDVSVSGYYDIFSVKESVSKEYMENFLLSEPMINYYNRVSTGSLKEKQRVHFSQFLDFVLPIPPLPEQQKIAEILSTQDKLIELQEKKIEQLKELKKAYLQKMFPKKGSKYPELRFKGFTDPWEQRKLSDTLNFLSNNTLSRAELSEDTGTYKNVHYGDVLIKFGEYIDAQSTDLPYIADDEKAKKFESSKLQDGDIIIADTAEDEAVGKCVEIGNIGDLSIVSGLHTIPCRPKVKFAPAYLGFYLNSASYHDQLIPLMQGIKVTSISKSAISDTMISAPTNLSEQGKIGQFFTQLDSLITLHQRKSEQEKQKKKALMQLLLTGKVRCK